MTKQHWAKEAKHPKKPFTASLKKPVPDSNRIKWIVGILIVSFIALSPILNNEYINYDDDIYVTENPMILSLDASKLFGEFYMNQYSPLSMLIMGTEYKINNDTGFVKLISVLFHLLNSFLLYKVLSLLFKKAEFILIPVALFALHPMQIESVAWTAASMKIGCYAAFFLSSIYFYLKYLERKKTTYYFVSILLFIFSCLSKEQAFVLSVVIIAVDYLQDRNLFDKKIWLEKIPFLLITVVFGIISLKASASSGSAPSIILSYSLADRLLISNYTFFLYAGKLLIPYGLSAFYTYPTLKEMDVLYYLPVLGLAALIYGFYRSIKQNNRIILFGILFFIINIGLPILSQLMGARDVMMADRYVYMPSIGFFLIVAYGVVYLKEHFKVNPIFLYSGCIIYTLILALSSYSQSKVWHDSISLFSDVIEKGNKNGNYNPYLSLPFNNRGIEFKRQGNYDAALRDYNMAIEINPNDPKSYANKGNIDFQKNNPQAAIAEYNKSLAINPNQAIALSSRGAAYGMLGKFDSALTDLTRSIELDPYARDTYMNRCLVYFSLGKYNEALNDVNKHLELKANDYNSYSQRGLIYLNMHKTDLSIRDLTTAINLQPSAGANYLNRSLAYKELGNKNAAMQDALKAKESGMQVSEEYLNTLK